MRRLRQRGVALLVAIVIFAIATTVAAAITYNKTMTARRAAATFTVEQALQAGMAAEALASIALEDAASKPTIDLSQDWAQVLDPLEIPDTGIWIQSKVEDLSGRFNINSLIYQDQTGQFVQDTHQWEIFVRLLGDLKIDSRYADLLEDWIDPNNNPGANGGGEDTLYLTQTPAYRPPNTFVFHTSELLALPGFGAENYRKLAPFITALPTGTKLNVCTASGLVLDATRNDPIGNQSEYAELPLEIVKQNREKGCWPRMNAVFSVLSNPALQTTVQSRIVETSSWFQLRTNIRIGTAEFVLYSLMYVDGNKKLRTMQRTFGSE